MIKVYECTAEINMDASKYMTVIVKANTIKKAYKFATEKMKKNGAFFVGPITIKEVSNERIN